MVPFSTELKTFPDGAEPRTKAPAVLIVGAGPTGLTLACELARRGIALRLLEAAAGPQPGSRGKGLQPRTLEVFEDLGIAERVLAHGRMGMAMRSVGPDGRVTETPVATPAARPDVPYPASLITPQWRIEEALRLRLADFGVAVEFGTALLAFEQSKDGITAQIVKEGTTETVSAHWLVGCDGGHSAVRKQAGIRFEGETREEMRMIVADVEVDGLGRDAWQIWRHAEGFASLCPLPSTALFQYQASLVPGQSADLGLPNMQALLTQRSGRSDLRLHKPKWASLWRANVRLADRFREGRVFLAGDAAHIHSPAGGQGMNTGIQDAQNLGWKLAAVVQGAAPVLLESYEAERRPVAAGVLALSEARLKEAIGERGIPIRRDSSILQLGIRYRDSALARDDRADSAELRAGDRAPDATFLMTSEGQRRLFELTCGGHFTLLDFGSGLSVPKAFPEVRTLRVAARAVAPGDIVDVEGHLAKAYGAGERTLVLIRPDGYVGLISDAGDPDALSNYLGLIGGSYDPGTALR